MEIKITERAAVTRIAGWMNEIIKEKELPFGYVDSELILDKKYPDLVIRKKDRAGIACVIEFKRPDWSVYDGRLIEDAGSKAWKTGAEYFGTWNTNKLVLWDTFEKNIPLHERRIAHYEVVEVKRLEDIEKKDIEAKIKEFLRQFLVSLNKIYTGEITLTKLPIDEFFIRTLRSIIDAIYVPISEKIKGEYATSKKFKENLNLWCTEQGWTIPSTDEDFERIARQYAYLFVDKVLFYNSLRTKFKDLDEIAVFDRVERAEELKKVLQSSFLKAAEKDYKIVFLANFIETLPLPDQIVPSFASFINGMAKYDFSEIGYDVIGRVFERLIPEEERHRLGQYYTRSDVVDIINFFCIKNADATVLDPACGAGTFLVRAYQRKRKLNPELKHEEILSTLYGIDISKFAVHLSTINLVNMNLAQVEVHPQVYPNDFFEVAPSSQVSHSNTKGKGKLVLEPVDAVVENPPYTRQEELGEASTEEYKEKLNKLLKKELEFEIGKRAGIYGYFFLHGYAFLKNSGRFGFITSNSWLDVDYGKYLQEFFLKNYKIIAVLESKIERWFEDADINTCITILERCNKEKDREENLVKFVYLKKKLKELLKAEDENKRWSDIENLVKLIESTNELYEDKNLRIYPLSQKWLWEEGYDEEEQKYAGSKWGKYIRAPDIFFKVLEKGKDLLVPLKEIAEVRRGFTTGANEFFYLTDEDIKRWRIEKRYVFPLLKSPVEFDSITTDPKRLRYKVLMVNEPKNKLKKTNVLRYIEWGEEPDQNFHKRPTCVSRDMWYSLGKRKTADLLWSAAFNVRFAVFLNSSKLYSDKRFYDILCAKKDKFTIGAVLNSTIIPLIIELFGRTTLGQGALDTTVYELKSLPMINSSELSQIQTTKLEKAFDKLSKRPIGSVFEEIGASSPEEVSLDRVKPDRRKLDKIVMGNILGLIEKEQLEVYKAVIDLVKSRIEKAKSVKSKKEKKQGDVEVLANHILEEIGKPKKFPDEYLKKEELYKEIKIPKGEPELGNDLHGVFVKINEEKLRFEDKDEANYVFYATLNKLTQVKIPIDKETLQGVLKAYARAYKNTKEKIEELSSAYIPDKRLREKVKTEVWKKIVTS